MQHLHCRRLSKSLMHWSQNYNISCCTIFKNCIHTSCLGLTSQANIIYAATLFRHFQWSNWETVRPLKLIKSSQDCLWYFCSISVNDCNVSNQRSSCCLTFQSWHCFFFLLFFPPFVAHMLPRYAWYWCRGFSVDDWLLLV